MIQPLSEDTKTTLSTIPSFKDSPEATAWLEWTETSLRRLIAERGLYRELNRIQVIDTALRMFTAASLAFAVLFQVLSRLQAPHFARFFSYAHEISPLLVGCSYLFYRYGSRRIQEIQEELEQLEVRLDAFGTLSQNQIPCIERVLEGQIPNSEGENSPPHPATGALQDLERLKEALIRENIISAKKCEASLALDSPLRNGEGSGDSSH